MKEGVSIVVLNFNGLEQLPKCLTSIFHSNQGDTPCEVIVVDNGSKDKSVKYVQENFPQGKIIEMGCNAGYCKANNVGAKEARYPLVFFLNNDTTVTDHFLAPIIKHFEDPEVFAVSPKVLRIHENMLDESIIVASFKGGCINPDNKISKNISPVPCTPLEIFNACGAAMMVDKTKFLKLGGFDELFYPFYLEETDLCYRAWKMGWKTLYEPKSTIFHEHDRTIGQRFRKFKIKASYRKNQYLFVWKNITSPRLLFSHFLEMIIPKLLIPNLTEWAALFWAIKQLPQVIKKRSWNRFAKLSDQDVFNRTAYLLKYLK